MVTPETWRDHERGALLAGAEVLGAGQDDERGPVLVRGGRILAVGPAAAKVARSIGAARLDLSGGSLAPGFVDLHTHGAVGVDFVEAGPEDFLRAMQHYLAHGVTSLLVSLYPSSWKESLEVLRRVSGFIRRRLGGGIARGIHLEGPFLSASRPGALPARNFRPPSLRDAERLLEAGGGCVRTMTVAPELAGAHEVIRFLRRRRVVPAFGHSDADYVEAGRAVASGVHYATHLFNAMRGLHHRDPGAVTALLENPEVAVELIGDGHHVDIPVLGLVRRLKPPDKIVLVSDSAHPCGLADGVYRFAGGEVILRDGRVTRPDGTLAGSALTLDRAVAIQVKRAGTPLAEAVRYATRNAVQAARLSPQRGAIAPGKRADLVLLDRRLQVAATWLDGKLVYCRRPLRSG